MEKPGLIPRYDQKGDILLKKQDTLRKLIGILGMSLPVLLYLCLQIDSGFNSVLPSISHYYYTRSSGIFVITVSLMAIFLLVYKGEELKDFFASFVAGIFALLLLLFPTGNLKGLLNSKFDAVNQTILKESEFRPIFHYLSAAIFLSSLAYMSFFLFTKSDKPPGKRPKTKIKRNRIYRVCSIIMLIAIIVIFLGFINIIPPKFYDENYLTFWMEVLAVEAFGFSWMVKGKSLFTDKQPN